jgi:hypothetical protein
LFFPDLLDPTKKIALRAPDGNKDSKYPPPVKTAGGKYDNKDAYLQRPVTGHGGFYDYTKVPARMEVYARWLSTTLRQKKNDLLQACKDYYHLTFSFSGHNEADSIWHLERGGKVAIVFVLERLERHGSELLRRGAKTVSVRPDVTRQALNLPRNTDTKTVTILGQLLKYADDGTYNQNSDLGRFLREIGGSLPADPRPREREFWAAETASRLGFSFAPNAFRLPVSPDKAGNLRGEFEQEWFYGFEFKQGPFAGYPILNADRNDLRAKDSLILQKHYGKDGPALVGLDFKVAKIRVALDEYAIVVRLGRRDLQFFDRNGKPVGEREAEFYASEKEAQTQLLSGRYPREAFVRRMGELHQVKLDLEKNSFVTPVYKEGDVFYVAQTPSQTMDGSQEHG